MLKNREINGTEEIGLVTPTPGPVLAQICVICVIYASLGHNELI